MKNLKLTLILLVFFFTSCERSEPENINCPVITVSSTPVCGASLCCELSYLSLQTSPYTTLNNISDVFVNYNSSLLFTQTSIPSSYSGQSVPFLNSQGGNELAFRDGPIPTQTSPSDKPYTIQFTYTDGNGVQQTCITEPFQITRTTGIDSDGINLFYHPTPLFLNPTQFNNYRTNVFFQNDPITLYEANSDIVNYTLELEELDQQGNVISTTPHNQTYYPPADNNIDIKNIFNIGNAPTQTASRMFRLNINTRDCTNTLLTISKEFRLDYRVRQKLIRVGI